MYITIDHASQFRDQFNRCGRGDQFSYEGLGLLFDYLEEIDPQYELDVIALCCEYSESTPLEVFENYGIELNEDEKEDAIPAAMEYLKNHTEVIGITSSGSIIYQQF